MRSSVIVIATCLLLAGCGQAEKGYAPHDGEGDRSAASADAASESAAAGPGINITSAPGVAFDYNYAFRLLPGKVASVQEEHAQLCEKLGINRCRITGMRYSVEDEDRISASLAFKLDPAIARNFGKQGIAAVTKAEGMLVNAEITGVDAGSAIKQADRGLAELRAELEKLEGQIRQPGLPASVRAQLTQPAADLREQIRSLGEVRTANQQSLATTPMVFEYRSGHSIPGLDGGSPLAEALEVAVRSFMTMLSFVLIAIGALLPWVLLVWAGFWAARRLRPDWFKARAKTEPVPESPPAG